MLWLIILVVMMIIFSGQGGLGYGMAPVSPYGGVVVAGGNPMMMNALVFLALWLVYQWANRGGWRRMRRSWRRNWYR